MKRVLINYNILVRRGVYSGSWHKDNTILLEYVLKKLPIYGSPTIKIKWRINNKLWDKL